MKSINRKTFIENYIKIKDKSGNIIDFKFNPPQLRLYDVIKNQFNKQKPVRIIILKSRQMGFSTETEGIIFTNTILRFNVSSGIVTHLAEATSNLFEMSKLMYEKLPDKLKPNLLRDNSNELVFNTFDGTGLNSKIKCMTAGSKGVGRSATYQFLHLSEYAFWPGDKKSTLNGLIQSVPSLPGTMVILESTANGFDHFKEMWDKAVAGENDFIPVFFPWFEMPDYSMKYDGFELTEKENDIKNTYNLTLEQIAWRRWCIKNNCDSDEDLFKQEYPSNPEEAFLSTGNCIFDKDKVAERIQKIRKPLRKGYFKYDYNSISIDNIEFIESSAKSYIEIYEEPLIGYPYVLGGDPAGIGTDSFCGDVINNVTANQVATLEILLDEDEYTRQMYCLGMFYNEALICIETNYSTYPTKELWRLNYTNQYQRMIDDSINIKIQDKLGFNTNRSTRPVIIAEIVKFFKENIDKINCVKTLKEALTFIKRPDGKKAADDGYHDDRIMSFAIAYAAREQQSYVKEQKEEDKKSHLPFALQDDITDDNLDDEDDIGFGLEW